jgi:AcrR family transcriptional regulator
MARPRNASGPRTRQAILDAALDLFGERGFFGTTLRDVARTVGVRESALYNYFPSKEALFEALIAADEDEKRERLSAALDDPTDDPRAVLERLARLSLEDFASPRQRQLFRILMSDGLRLARAGRLNLVDRMGSSRTRVRDAMQQFIDRGWLRDGDPEMLAIAFAGPLLVWRHLLAIDADLALVRDPEAFVRQHVDNFLRGAAARPDRLVAPRGPRTSRARAAKAAARRQPARQRA